MNKLGDYAGILRRGDYIKYFDEWHEVINPLPSGACEVVGNTLYARAPISAVLRPSFILRDLLDGVLHDLKNVPLRDGRTVFFEELKPKERETSLFQKVAQAQKIHNEPRVLNALMLICEEIDTLNDSIKGGK